MAFAQTVQKALDEILTALLNRSTQARILLGEVPIQQPSPPPSQAAGPAPSTSSPAPSHTTELPPRTAPTHAPLQPQQPQPIDPTLAEHPLVRKTIDLFNARVVKVRPKQPTTQPPQTPTPPN